MVIPVSLKYLCQNRIGIRPLLLALSVPLLIRDVEGPRRTGSVETRLEAMEQQVFKCQEMVEHGLDTNHIMIAEFTNNHKLDAKNIGENIFKLHDKIEHLQA